MKTHQRISRRRQQLDCVLICLMPERTSLSLPWSARKPIQQGSWQGNKTRNKSTVISYAYLREESGLNTCDYLEAEQAVWVCWGVTVFEEGSCSTEKPTDPTHADLIDLFCFLQVISLLCSLGYARQHVTYIQP